MNRRTKLAAIAAAALTLTGCAGLRPGTAATVGDETISTQQIDAFAKGLCAYNLANGAPGAPSSDLRLSAVRALVISRLAHRFGEDNDLDLAQPDIEATMAQVKDNISGLSADEREDFLEQARYTLEGDDYMRQAAIALVEAQGLELSNETGQAAQQALLEEWSNEADIELDPRFGEWDNGNLVAGTGSISVTDDPPTASIDDLPKSQTCS